MKLATWNVNSVKARVDTVTAWLKDAEPDVVCFQELKTTDDAFPKDAFEALGYNCAVYGQKTYNGVAILSKHPVEDVVRGLPEADGDDHARYIEAVVPHGDGVVRVASVYAPNGNPPESDRFVYKLRWLERLRKHTLELLAHEEPFALTGDFNVIPTPDDCHDPKAWENDALFQPESRAALRRLSNLGLTDAFRVCHAEPHRYTFWDYQGGAWQKDHGIRIDHILLSPQAADMLAACDIDRRPRSWERPSDHVPVWCELA
ncbi:MAG: exodeoxyribonuclease III [Alphaproteobacteria bacterium]